MPSRPYGVKLEFRRDWNHDLKGVTNLGTEESFRRNTDDFELAAIQDQGPSEYTLGTLVLVLPKRVADDADGERVTLILSRSEHASPNRANPKRIEVAVACIYSR